MKKLSILTLALFVFAGTAYGQKSDNASTTAKVRVVSGLSLQSDGRVLDYGDVVMDGSEKTLSISATGDEAVKFTATGEGGEEIKVTWTADNLSPADGTGNNLSFNEEVVSSTSEDQTGAQPRESSDNVMLNGTNASQGNHYFWVGGTVTIPSGAEFGKYSGTFDLTVTYTSF